MRFDRESTARSGDAKSVTQNLTTERRRYSQYELRLPLLECVNGWLLQAGVAD